MTGADAPSTESTQELSGSIRESEERFRKIFENAATAIAISDWQGRFQQCNPAYCTLLGYSEQELHEINFASLVHPADRQANLAELRRLQTGEVPSFEIENRYVQFDSVVRAGRARNGREETKDKGFGGGQGSPTAGQGSQAF